jgi:hypothetical protein
MRHRFSNPLLSSSVLGLVLGLGMQANAATLYPGTELLSDTPEFLDFKFNLYSLPADFCNIFGPPPNCGSFPPNPGPEYSLLLGQNWNVFASIGQGNLFGRDVNLFVEQVTQNPNPTLPRATFIASESRGFVGSFPPKVSYLTTDPPEVFNTITCSFGSPNCVTYELGALSPRITEPGIGFIPPIFELKGFFKPQQVPEPKTGIGALAALGLMMLIRTRQYFFQTKPKSLP